MKRYHFYFDEGGMFGNANVYISTKRRLEIIDSESDISNYYFGELELKSIVRHLQLFNQIYPKCKINYDNLSEVKNLDLETIGC
jgi:hypothetical protein